MDKKYYENMYNSENFHWWFVGKRYLSDMLINKFIKRTDMEILDIGCGSGIMLTHLKKHGNVIGVDDSEVALSFCKKRGHIEILKASADYLPFNDEKFDLVTCYDILSHQRVKNDIQVLRELYRVLKKGGWIITSEPAFRFLWSGHDVFEKTRDRYTKKNLIKKVKDSGFIIKKITYWNTTLFFIIFIIRMVKNFFLGKNKASSDLWVVHPAINKILTLILKFEAYLLQRINLPFGVSVLCLGKK